MRGWCERGEGRASWDPMAVLYAVRGPMGFFSEGERGTATIAPDNGASFWEPAWQARLPVVSTNWSSLDSSPDVCDGGLTGQRNGHWWCHSQREMAVTAPT